MKANRNPFVCWMICSERPRQRRASTGCHYQLNLYDNLIYFRAVSSCLTVLIFRSLKRKSSVKRTSPNTQHEWKRFASKERNECANDVVPIRAIIVVTEVGIDAEDLFRDLIVDITDVKVCEVLCKHFPLISKIFSQVSDPKAHIVLVDFQNFTSICIFFLSQGIFSEDFSDTFPQGYKGLSMSFRHVDSLTLKDFFVSLVCFFFFSLLRHQKQV